MLYRGRFIPLRLNHPWYGHTAQKVQDSSGPCLFSQRWTQLQIIYLFAHFDNSAFCNIFAKSNRFDAFLRNPFARMAELVDALDSKSNVLKKTCRFEPGFGHKKRWGSSPSSLFVPSGTFIVGGETEDWLYFVISTVQADREVTLAKVKSEESLEASSPQRLIFSRRRCFIPAAVHSLTLSEN